VHRWCSPHGETNPETMEQGPRGAPHPTTPLRFAVLQLRCIVSQIFGIRFFGVVCLLVCNAEGNEKKG